MAKVSFTKLQLTKEQGVTTIEHNGQEIEVKKYLPLQDKLDFISNVMNNSYDGVNNFLNPLKVNMFISIEIVKFYTNINLTEKQQEDPFKLYDLLVGSDLITEIKMAIPVEELRSLISGTLDTIEAFYKYNNSVLGILDTVSRDYSNLEFDAEHLKEEIADPNNMSLLKNIVSQLG